MEHAFRLAVEYFQSGRLEEAEHELEELRRAAPTHPDVLHLLGVIALQTGRPGVAARHLRKAVGVAPEMAELHNLLGAALHEDGSAAKAVAPFERAIALDPDLTDAHYNFANALKSMERFEAAVEHYRRVVELDPDFADAHFNLGLVLDELGRMAAAVESLARAVELEPKDPQAQLSLGFLLVGLNRMDEAIDAFRQARELQPDSAIVCYRLADALEKANRPDEAQAVVDEGLALAPDDAGVNLVASRLLRRAGDVEAALERLLAAVPGERGERATPDMVIDRHFELGQVHDRLDETASAFASFEAGNRMLAERWRSKGQKPAIPTLIAACRSQVTGDWIATWTPTPRATEPVPVFLMGFPRSGTTLLGRILDAHPKLQTLDEEHTIYALRGELVASGADYPAALATLSADEIADLRRRYWRHAATYIDPAPDRLLVDKMPLHMIDIPLIHRLFPDAKLIFAARHPCDACLSCFMQWFVVNEAMSNFHTIEGTARFYAEVMSLWRQYEAALPLDVHRLHYEDLVGDFDGEIGRLLEFLGLEWDDSVRDYADRATRNPHVATPSYAQVTEPIYTRASGRWRRYADSLALVMPVLQPFIDDLGYGAGAADG